MCDAAELLSKMRHLQVKPKVLQCKASSQCWCNKISYRVSHLQNFDECLSPKEIYEQGGTDLTTQDKLYLKSLFSMEFNPNPF